MKPAAIKKIIVAAGKGEGNGPTLYVNDVGGVSYATDSYWAAPVAGPLRDLFAQYNLTGDEPGTYRVNGTITHEPETHAPPDIARLIADHVAADRVELTPVLVGGRQAYVKDGANLLAVFVRPDGANVALRVDFLDIVAGEDWSTPFERTGGKASLVIEQDEAGPLKAVGVRRVVVKSDAYTNGESKPRVETSHVALIMPVRVS